MEGNFAPHGDVMEWFVKYVELVIQIELKQLKLKNNNLL